MKCLGHFRHQACMCNFDVIAKSACTSYALRIKEHIRAPFLRDMPANFGAYDFPLVNTWKRRGPKAEKRRNARC